MILLNEERTGDVGLARLEKTDRAALLRFFFRLSPETLYRRFHSPIGRPEQVTSHSVVERFGALRAVRELESCSDQEVRSLVGYTDEVRLGAGERVAEEGRLATEFLVVIEGTLRARSGLMRHGDSCGWDAMWERSTNPATVVAQTNARVLVMSHSQFRAVKALVGHGPCAPVEARVQIVA